MRLWHKLLIIIVIMLIILACIKYLPNIIQDLNNIQNGGNISIQHRGNKVSNSEVNNIGQKQTDMGSDASPEAVVSDKAALIQLIVRNLSIAKDTVVTVKDESTKKDINTLALDTADQYGYSGYISDLSYSVKGDNVYLHFNYKGGSDYFLRCINAVNSKVKSIISKVISPGMSEYEKELAVHNYVVNNVTYDYDRLQNNTLTTDDYTAYGALINGVAVCQGYAEAMYRLLNSAGINNLIVAGKGNNIDHAWNIVKINGSYYHLDATFDDPVSNIGTILSYGYFNISDSEIAVDHIWDASRYPACTSMAENYYVINHLIAKDRNSFYNIVKNGLLRKQTVIRCRTYTYDEKTFNPMVVVDAARDNNINYINTKKDLLSDYNKSTCEIMIFISYK